MTSDRSHHVLVVDDEEDVGRFLEAILTDAGFTVSRATNGERALEIVGKSPPDLISLDLVMPGKSGTKFLYALRKNREWARIPVLVVTGHGRDELGKKDLEEILAGKVISGPAVYLEKPVTPKSYVAAVKRQLGLAEDVAARVVLPPGADVKQEIARELESADPATMRRVLGMLRGAPAEPGAAPEKAHARVLVIDDEPDVGSYLAALLSDAGYDTETATNVEDALARARSAPPDLITLDVDMPGKSGVRLYRDIKGDAALAEVPVIVITGIQQDLAPLFTGKRTVPDIDGYLQKPFDPKVLFATVATALKRRNTP
jgi:DNA-binding response OmpR family regulator